MFNLAIDSKLRGCDVVALRVEDVAAGGYAADRATVRQKKTRRAIRFELSEQTRQAVDDYLRHELSDFEWAAIRSFLPNKPHGIPRVDDRRVRNGIFWVLRSGVPGVICRRPMAPPHVLQSLRHWRRPGVWDRIIDALAAGHDAAVQLIDTSIVRVHQRSLHRGQRSLNAISECRSRSKSRSTLSKDPARAFDPSPNQRRPWTSPRR
jgi:transposase